MRAAAVLLGLALAAGGVAAARAARAARRPAGAPAAETGPGSDRRMTRAAAAFDAAGTGAVQRIPVPERDLFAFRVRGTVPRADLRAMARFLSAAFALRGRIDVLIALPGFDGLEPGALFDGKALGAMLRSNLHVRRYAVIGPPPWAAAAIRALDPFTPVDARTFDPDDAPAAWAWVRDRAAPREADPVGDPEGEARAGRDAPVTPPPAAPRLRQGATGAAAIRSTWP